MLLIKVCRGWISGLDKDVYPNNYLCSNVWYRTISPFQHWLYDVSSTIIIHVDGYIEHLNTNNLSDSNNGGVQFQNYVAKLSKAEVGKIWMMRMEKIKVIIFI